MRAERQQPASYGCTAVASSQLGNKRHSRCRTHWAAAPTRTGRVQRAHENEHAVARRHAAAGVRGGGAARAGSTAPLLLSAAAAATNERRQYCCGRMERAGGRRRQQGFVLQRAGHRRADTAPALRARARRAAGWRGNSGMAAAARRPDVARKCIRRAGRHALRAPGRTVGRRRGVVARATTGAARTASAARQPVVALSRRPASDDRLQEYHSCTG